MIDFLHDKELVRLRLERSRVAENGGPSRADPIEDQRNPHILVIYKLNVVSSLINMSG